MAKFSIIIGTYGSLDWGRRGHDLFIKTQSQFPSIEVIHMHHQSSLAEARNTGAIEAKGDYLVFLDADDYLCDGYIDAFREALEEDSNVLYKPITMGFNGEELEEPQFVKRTVDMLERNELIIGTGLAKEKFLGFDPTLEALEDWDLWIRMIRAGAKVKECADMCYAINTDITQSRNNMMENQSLAFSEIRRKYGTQKIKVERI